MRPLLAGLAASAFLLVAAGAQAAPASVPASPTTAPTPSTVKAVAAKPVATKPPVVQTGEVTPKLVAASMSPDFVLKATLYHAGAKGVGGIDSIGCKPVAMRTAATDPKLIPRRTVLFIAETVGAPLPGGGVHDGFWYASDVGGAIKGNRIDLYTGNGSGSMRPIKQLSLAKVRVMKVSSFRGCPPTGAVAAHSDFLMQLARRSGVFRPTILAIDLLREGINRVRGATPGGN